MWPGFGGPPPAAYYGTAQMYRAHFRHVWALLQRVGSQAPAGPVASVAAILGQVGVAPATAVDSMLRIPSNMNDGWSWHGLRWWAERGDTADLERFFAARKAHKGFDRTREERPSTYDTAVTRAYLWLARHDTADAMQRFEALPDTLCGGSCLLDAITLGQLLVSHGRAAAADSLLQRQYEGPNTIRDLALARAAERAGDRATAVDAYGKVEDAWARGDPEVQPLVSEARAALARLGPDVH
jgi:hypothetical protein